MRLFLIRGMAENSSEKSRKQTPVWSTKNCWKNGLITPLRPHFFLHSFDWHYQLISWRCGAPQRLAEAASDTTAAGFLNKNWQVLLGGPSNFCRQKLPQDFSCPLPYLVSLVSLALCRWSNSVAMHWPFTSRHCPQSFQTFRKLGSWAGWCATWLSRLWMIQSTRSTTMWFLHMGHGVGCLVVAGTRGDSDYRRSVSAAESTSIPKDVTFASCTFVFVRKIGYPQTSSSSFIMIFSRVTLQI